MKKFKIIIMVMTLIGLIALSTLLCACNTDAKPTDKNDTQPSGNIEQQPSGNVETQPPTEKKERPSGYVNPDWVKIYRYNELSLRADKCSAIINSSEELNAFCDVDTSSCLKTSTVYDLYPNITEEQLKENEEKLNYYVKAVNEANNQIIDILKKYDEQFFQEKSLVVLFSVRGSIGYGYNYKEHQIDGNTLNINLVMIEDGLHSYPMAMGTFFYIMEFDKEEVDGVEQINFTEIIEYV